MGNVFKCCGKTGKPAVRIIAYIDIVLAILILLGWILGNVYFPCFFSQEKEGSLNAKNQHIVGIILAVSMFFVECCLLNILLSSIKNRNTSLCNNWIKIRLFLLVIFIFFFIYWMIGTKTAKILLFGGLPAILYIFYRVYSLVVVKAYQNEITPKKYPLEIPMELIVEKNQQILAER